MVFHILRLPGVTIDDIYKKTKPKKQPSKTGPITLHERFVSISTWPTKTQLCCWWCGLTHDNYPKFIPMSVEPSGACSTEGSFCEWSCVCAYVVRRGQNVNNILELVKKYCGIFSDKRPMLIPLSPSPTVRKEYSGDNGLTEEEYRKIIEDLNRDYNIIDI
jgi:hypothetical protein